MRFCERFLKKSDRTYDQMVQAARSGKQNILEGSEASGISKETEIKLTGVARASLGELLEDYRDFLRLRGAEEWPKEHRYTKRLRQLNRQPGANYETFKKGIEHPDPLIAANVMIGLIKLTNYLLMSKRSPVVDAHTHIFCWGENPKERFLSEQTRSSRVTRLLLRVTGITREPGDTLSDKLRNRLLRELEGSSLNFAVVLAQDAVYRPDGSRDDAATHFYVSNDYVLELAKRSSKVLAGCSINPIRSDALEELERCVTAGSRLIKIHTAIQGVDPGRREFDPFYALARKLGVVLMFHTGYEHSCTVVSQQFTDPLRLERALSQGVTVVAAHCGTCAFFDPEDYYPNFVRMMNRYENLYGDTAIMASLIRWFSLRRLSREPDRLRQRIVHGSDYPFPPARLPYVFRTGLLPAERSNPLDLDPCIKRTFRFGSGYESRILSLLNLKNEVRAPATAQADRG